jgi:hypothetical protein
LAWLGPVFAHEAPAAATASDGKGTWISVRATERSADVYVRRSTDDGATWSEPALLAQGQQVSADCASCRFVRADVAAGAAGVWGRRMVVRRPTRRR